MEKLDLSGRLRELAVGEDRPLYARVKDHYPAIEDAIQAGVSYASILRTLAEAGINVQPGTFRNMITRMRKEAACQQPQARSRESDQAAAAAPEPVPAKHQTLGQVLGDSPDLKSLTKAAKRNRS